MRFGAWEGGCFLSAILGLEGTPRNPYAEHVRAESELTTILSSELEMVYSNV